MLIDPEPLLPTRGYRVLGPLVKAPIGRLQRNAITESRRLTGAVAGRCQARRQAVIACRVLERDRSEVSHHIAGRVRAVRLAVSTTELGCHLVAVVVRLIKIR